MKRVIDFGFLLLIALVGGALAAESVQAFEDDGTYQAGYHWAPTQYNTTLASPTIDVLCEKHGYTCADLVDYGDGTFWPRGDSSVNYRFKKYPCGFPYAACDFGVPSPDCPDEGAVKRVSTMLSGYMKDGVYHEDIPPGGLRITIGGATSVNGCGFAVPLPGGIGDGVDENSQIKCAPNKDGKRGICFRFQNLVATGQALEPAQDAASTYLIGDPEYPKEETASTDTRESSVTKTSSDPVTEQVGDKTVTTKTDITTETRGDGSVVETQEDQTIVTQSDGITKTVTETTTTTTNADGSQTVETTTNTSFTQHPQNIYNIDNSTSRVTQNTVPGSSASQTSTSTRNIDSNGNVTSQTETAGPIQGDSSVKEEQEAQENGEEEQTCETNPLMDKCIDDFTETEPGTFPDISAKITEAKSDFESNWQAIKSEASSKLGFTLSGGGTLQDHVVNIRGIEGDIGITRWVPYFDEFGLSALIMAGAALYSAVVMFRG